ncbi:hypothetical protein [Natrinema salaciae]|uniref:hypothetical protein n=1 Tax=Natrinema salaciae TaxID=1186196 RepID=UPI001FE124CE|nr:hypothetical protein [Natrinema salaciae]
MTVSVAGDGSGALSLDDTDGNTAYTEASTISNGTLELSFDSLGSSSGLNVDAETEFNPLFRAINNGSNSINLSIYSADGNIQTSPSILTDYSVVIENTLNDGNGNSLTIEYAFTDGSSSIVGDGSTGSSVTLTEESGTDPTQEISLVIGVGDPGTSFDLSTASGYITSISILAAV